MPTGEKEEGKVAEGIADVPAFGDSGVTTSSLTLYTRAIVTWGRGSFGRDESRKSPIKLNSLFVGDKYSLLMIVVKKKVSVPRSTRCPTDDILRRPGGTADQLVSNSVRHLSDEPMTSEERRRSDRVQSPPHECLRSSDNASARMRATAAEGCAVRFGHCPEPSTNVNCSDNSQHSRG